MKKSPVTFENSCNPAGLPQKATCQKASGQLLYIRGSTSFDGVESFTRCPTSPTGENKSDNNEKAENGTNHHQTHQSLHYMNTSNLFELLDGSKLEGYPSATPTMPISNTLALDTTGQYLSIGRKPTKAPIGEEEKRQLGHKLFNENVHLFLANADKILSDSRLFLAPVPVQNGLAYTGTGGFRHPTLGVYIEWWLYYKEDSIDRKGRPIWYISGSPLSGRNVCSSVDRKGKAHRAELNGLFSDVWGSFTEVNTRYDEAKSRFLAYSLEEVVALLKEETDDAQLFKTHLRLEYVKFRKEVDSLKSRLRSAQEQTMKYQDRLRKMLFESKREEATAYYEKWQNLRTVAKLRYEHFIQRRLELRKQLRADEITNKEYQQTLQSIRKAKEDADYAIWDFAHTGLSEVFGSDASLFSTEVLDQIIKNN